MASKAAIDSFQLFLNSNDMDTESVYYLLI